MPQQVAPANGARIVLSLALVGYLCSCRLNSRVQGDDRDWSGLIDVRVSDDLLRSGVARHEWGIGNRSAGLMELKLARWIDTQLEAKRVSCAAELLSTWDPQHTEEGDKLLQGPARILRECSTTAATAYDIVLARALKTHFIDGNAMKARDYYRTAMKLAPFVGERASPWSLVHVMIPTYKELWPSALTVTASPEIHMQRLRELMNLPANGGIEKSPRSVAPISLMRKQRSLDETSYAFTNKTAPVDACLLSILHRALLADRWNRDWGHAVQLCELALSIMQLQEDEKDPPAFEVFTARLEYLRMQCRERSGNARLFSETHPTEITHWRQPGFALIYYRIVLEALMAELCEKAPDRALGLYRIAFRLAQGFDGSTSLAERDRIEARTTSLEKALGT